VVLNLSWFVVPFHRLSTLVASCSSVGFCNITAELSSKGLCSWPPRGSRAPVEKPYSRLFVTKDIAPDLLHTVPFAELVFNKVASWGVRWKHRLSCKTKHTTQRSNDEMQTRSTVLLRNEISPWDKHRSAQTRHATGCLLPGRNKC